MGRNPQRHHLLPVSVVQGVERLLQEGHRRAKAAQLMGVDWKTADQIARGRHIKQRDKPCYVRCPGCGGLVLLPCLLCDLRAKQSQSRTLVDIAQRPPDSVS